MLPVTLIFNSFSKKVKEQPAIDQPFNVTLFKKKFQKLEEYPKIVKEEVKEVKKDPKARPVATLAKKKGSSLAEYVVEIYRQKSLEYDSPCILLVNVTKPLNLVQYRILPTKVDPKEKDIESKQNL